MGLFGKKKEEKAAQGKSEQGVEAAGELPEDGSVFQRHGGRHFQRLLGAGRRGGGSLPDSTFHESGVFLIRIRRLTTKSCAFWQNFGSGL